MQYTAATCTAARQNYKSCVCGYNPQGPYLTISVGDAFGHDLVANYLNVDYIVQWDCRRCSAHIIPDGAVYTLSDGTKRYGGEEFPAIQYGDVYQYKGYEYRYRNLYGGSPVSDRSRGRNITAIDKTLSSYKQITNHIGYKDVLYMQDTFKDCTNLVYSPSIPNTIELLDFAYYNCTSLIDMPSIPSSVMSMRSTFSSCLSLIDLSNHKIPDNVIALGGTFGGCKSLQKSPQLSNSATSISGMFYNCVALSQAPTIPTSVTNMSTAFQWCESLQGTIIIPESITTSDIALQGCDNLTEIMMPCRFTDYFVKNFFGTYGYDSYLEKVVFYHISTCDGNCGR